MNNLEDLELAQRKTNTDGEDLKQSTNYLETEVQKTKVELRSRPNAEHMETDRR